MTAVVLQARLDSSRLPGKALLLLDGKPLVFCVMEALSHVRADLRVLACPEDSLAEFSPLAQKCGFEIFSGPKEDVLERYCLVIRHFGISRLLRATADNPFVFADAACAINEEAVALNADYSGYSGLPAGAGVESICASALLRAGEEAASSYDREHVCPYLYTHGSQFKLHRPLAPVIWQSPQIRLTVDTQEDFDKAVELYAALKDEPHRFNGKTIIDMHNKIFFTDKSMHRGN